MRQTSMLASAALLVGSLAAPVYAQMATGVDVPPPKSAHLAADPETPPTEYGEEHPYVREFNGYLDEHPEEAADLKKNPKLVRDPKYLASHPDLQMYLTAHPELAKIYERHPERFMHRKQRYERSKRRWEKRHRVPATN